MKVPSVALPMATLPGASDVEERKKPRARKLQAPPQVSPSASRENMEGLVLPPAKRGHALLMAPTMDITSVSASEDNADLCLTDDEMEKLLFDPHQRKRMRFSSDKQDEQSNHNWSQQKAEEVDDPADLLLQLSRARPTQGLADDVIEVAEI